MNQSQAKIQAIAARLQSASVPPFPRSKLEFASASDRPEPELLLWQQIDDQIQYLNQLAVEQETAILQLMAILQQVEVFYELPEAESQAEDFPESDVLWQFLRSAAAKVFSLLEGTVEAIVQATVVLGIGIKSHPLKFRASKFRALKARTARPDRRSRQFRPQGLSQPPISTEAELPPGEESEIFPTIQEALTLVLGFALLRVVLDRVVQLYPALWLVTILLMVVPAAVAVYRSTCAPQSGFLWGIRLTLILIGLLLGGRV